MIKPFKIERVKRVGGYRSKAPALNDKERVSCYTYSQSDLVRSSLDPSDVERRGSEVLQHIPGAFCPGFRVIGGR